MLTSVWGANPTDIAYPVALYEGSHGSTLRPVLLLVGVPLLFERLPLQDGLQPPQQVGADQRVGAAWTPR